MKLLTALGLALVGLTLAGLAVHVPGTDVIGSPTREVSLLVVMSAQGVIYLLAVRLVLRRPHQPRLIWLILGVAVAMRLPLLMSYPFLSSDTNRYVWDGRVQNAGINPYLYVPDDPALVPLRNIAVFPRINRADYAHTIYPPAAQVIFAAVAAAWQSVYAIKAAMLLFDLLAIWCVMRLLAIAGLARSRVLLYAWNPLVAWAFICTGHIDAAATGLLALAMLLRVRLRDTWAGVVFGAAALTKFIPLIVAPALWRARAGWRLATATLLTIAALYAVYAGAGRHVLGFLGEYGAEEGLNTGSGIWLLSGLAKLFALPRAVTVGYFAIAAVGLMGLGAWLAFRRHPPPGSPQDAVGVCRDAVLLMACVTLVVSPHYPWYFPWMALPAVLVPYRAALWLSVSPLILYVDPLHDLFIWSSVIYLPAVLLVLSALWRHQSLRPTLATEGNA
jgi:alpha-1,6-mannosyltransferase